MQHFPWSVEEAKSRGFRVRQQDGLTLITPDLKKAKWQFNPDDPYANDSELVWRSALLDENMDAVSLGFPKFPNWSEFGWDDYNWYISESIRDGTALLTAKEDGTLIIRSVHNGKVIWRTRNSFDLGPFHDPVMALVKQNHYLSEPELWGDCHMLFEYVAPTNQIVVAYDRPRLVLLAIRDDHEMIPYSYSVEDAFVEFGIEPIRIMQMSARDPIGLHREIDELEQVGLWDCEGLVVRTPDGLMSKIKGSEYLNVFRMKYMFKYGDFAALCLANGVTDFSEAKEICIANGVDWEVLTCAEEWFNAYSTRQSSITDAAIWAQDNVKTWQLANPNGIKRDFAAWVKNNAHNQAEQILAFVAFDDNPVKWQKTLAGLKDRAIFAPVTIEYRNPWFSLQEEA